MKAAEIMESTDMLLKKVNATKNELKLLDPANDSDKIKAIKFELSRIRSAISRLKEEDQRIICYRYFDNMEFSVIALRFGMSRPSISRRKKAILLDIGRSIFGMEDELNQCAGI